MSSKLKVEITVSNGIKKFDIFIPENISDKMLDDILYELRVHITNLRNGKE